MRKIISVLVGIPVVFALVLMLCASPVQGTYITEIDSGFATTAPTLDGNFTTEDEWSGAGVTEWFFEPTSEHPDNYIYLYFMNDNANLYILADVTPDDTAESDDYIMVGIDENNDDKFEADSAQEFRETWFVIERSGDAWYDVDKRYEIAWGFANESSNELTYNHTIIEMSIPLDILTYEEDAHGGNPVQTGDTIGIFLGGYGTLAPEWVFPTDADALTPTTNPDQAQKWGKLTLGTSEPVPPEPPEPPVVPTEPKDWSTEISMWVGIIGGIVLLGAVLFRTPLGAGVWAVVAVGLIMVVFAIVNYVTGYVTYIPYFLPQ